MTNSKKKIPLLNQEVGIVKEKKFCLGKPLNWKVVNFLTLK